MPAAKKARRKRAFNRPSRAAIRKANQNRPPSSLELLVYSWLEEDGIPFRREKAVGRCHVDIFLKPNICIELAGCYFHACPKCYSDPPKGFKGVRLKDHRRFTFLRSREMQVEVFWECDIRFDPDGQRARLRALGQIQAQASKKRPIRKTG